MLVALQPSTLILFWCRKNLSFQQFQNQIHQTSCKHGRIDVQRMSQICGRPSYQLWWRNKGQLFKHIPKDSDSKPMSFASRNQNVAQSERSPRFACYHQTWKFSQVSHKKGRFAVWVVEFPGVYKGMKFRTLHHCWRAAYLSPWMCLMRILPSIPLVRKSPKQYKYNNRFLLLTRRRQKSSFSRWPSNNHWSAVKYRRCHFLATALALGSCSWCMWKASHIDG